MGIANSMQAELMSLGLKLGADVPFFLLGSNAFVEGIGERLQAVQTQEQFFVVVEPGVHVPTPSIFSAKELTKGYESSQNNGLS